MKRFLFPLCLVAILLCQNTPSHAQIFETPASVSIGFGAENKQLATVLQLQYQMQVLKRLIEHERAVGQMVESSIAIGLNNPAINTPDRELCAQVPANLPCAEAYTDLYENFIGNRPDPIVTATPIEARAPILADSDVPNLSAQPLPDNLPAAQIAFDNLFWTDITCMAMKCSAVISPNPADPKARYRVVVGEKLPDGSTIERISAAGVSITRNGEKVSLEPAAQGA